MRRRIHRSESDKVKKKRLARKAAENDSSHVRRVVASLSNEQIQRMLDDNRNSFVQRKQNPTTRAIFNSVQAKLEISDPNDAAEKQADKVAEGVMKGDPSLSQRSLSRNMMSEISAKSDGGAMQTTDGFDSKLQGTKGQGQKLDTIQRKELESYTGTDLSGVNIHTNSNASEMSESINAKAFTHGQDIYFNEGNYNPASGEGKSLLAHEVAHTVQQSEGVQRKDKNPPKPAPTSSKEEALNLINGTELPAKSDYWPRVDPVKYMTNISSNVNDSKVLYQGEHTNFCGYAALMTYIIEKDPRGYAQMMIDLYTNGKATYHGGTDIEFAPRTKTRKGKSSKLAEAVGSQSMNEKFTRPKVAKDEVKGIADQVMFMTMADSYKGYVNFFDHHYDNGNENRPWAGTNLNKFVRMMEDFGYPVKVKGSDLGGESDLTPMILEEQTKENDIFLYVHSHSFKGEVDYNSIKNSTATHFIRIKNNSFKKDKMISMQFWDYGDWHDIEMSPDRFFWTTYGVVSVQKTKTDEQNKKTD